MCVVRLEDAVRHPRPDYGFKIGIVGHLRPWFALPVDADGRPSVIVIETVFPGRNWREAGAKALRLLHGRIPWYSWKADFIGKRRLRT